MASPGLVLYNSRGCFLRSATGVVYLAPRNQTRDGREFRSSTALILQTFYIWNMETKSKPQPRHLGRKISRIRELLGIKQETLAEQLGITQQAVSKIEQSEQVEDATLEKVAKALGVSGEAIRNFSEEAVINIVSSTLHDNAGSYNNNCTLTFNPVDKWLEAIEENKKLYEALLKSEREKVAMLEKILEGRKG